MKFTIPAIALCAFGLTAFGQVSDKEWQAKAVAKYPSLGVRGSELNKRFLIAYAERRKADPAFFANPKWPILLADQCARNLPAPKLPVTPLPIAITKRGVPAQAGSDHSDIVAFAIVMAGATVMGLLLFFAVRGRRRGETASARGRPMAPFEIRSSIGTNYLVKLVTVGGGKVVTTVFVRGGDTVKVNVPLGACILKYAAGDKWVNDRERFGPSTIYSKASKTFVFRQEGMRMEGFTITLYKVPNGNLPTETISAREF
jgi:hypothetical protein